MPSISGRQAVVIGILSSVVALVLGLLALVPLWKPWWDSAIYIDLSRSLLEDGSYLYMGYPHTKYPPGLPLLLTPVLAIFGADPLWLRAVGVLSAAIVAFASPFFLRRRLPLPWVVSASVLTGLAPSVLFFETYVLSDLPFAAVTLLALAVHPRRGEGSRARNVHLSVLLLGGCLLRLSGAALALALVVDGFLAKGGGEGRLKGVRTRALVAAPALLFVVFWVVRGAIVKTGLPPGLRESISYGSELALENADRWDSGTVGISGLLRRVVANVPYYGGLTGSLLRGSLSVGEDPVRLGLALLVPLGLILVFLDRRIGSRLPEIYLVASYALYLAWPAREEVRFLVPLLPIVLGTAAVAVDRTCRRLLVPSRRGSQALSLLAPLLAVVPGWLSVSECRKIILDERQGSYMTEGVIELREISYYLRDHAATGARVVSDSAPWVHFWSRRPTFTYPWVDDPEEVYRGLRSLDADYVLLTSLFREHTLALLQATLAHPQDFAVERREGKSVLLRVVGW